MHIVRMTLTPQGQAHVFFNRLFKAPGPPRPPYDLRQRCFPPMVMPEAVIASTDCN